MRVSLLLVLLLALSSGRAAAQSLTTGAIQGVVKDEETGQPLPGVEVWVGSQFAVTDTDGAYKLTEILPGTYDVVFKFEDASATKTGVMIGANDLRNINQRMKIGESIHVEGSAEDIPIRTDSTAKEKRIKRDQIEKLPNPGQTAEDAIGGVPGTQNDGAGVAISGSSGLENRWVVDGVDMTGLTYGNVGTSVLNAFVHEIIAVAGGYNAEYGRATGGIINIITRRGTDEIRGSVFGVVKPGIFTARTQAAPSNSSSIDVTGDNVYDGHVGFEVGGPLIKKHAWFYVGAAPQLARTNYTRTIKRQTDCRVTEANGKLSNCVPSLADGDPDLDPETGFYVTDKVDEEVRAATSRSTQMIGKINLAATPDQQGQISLIAQPSSSRSPALYGHPSTATKSWGLTTDTAARWSSKLNDSADEVEATIAWHRSTFNSGSLDPTLDSVPLQILQGGSLAGISGFGGESAATSAGCTDVGPDDPYTFITNCPMNTTYAIGGPGALARDIEQRRSARLGWIHRLKFFGQHEIKAGIDAENNSKVSTRLYSGGALIQNAGSSIVLNRYAEIAPPGSTDPRYDHMCSTPDPSGNATLRFMCRFLGGLDDPSVYIGGQTINWGAYLQDSWRIKQSLTFNAGIRYEEQRLRYAERLRNQPDPLTGNPVGNDAMVLKGNWSPRMGLIWDPTEEGRSKLYVNWGRYYEGIPMDINDRSFGGEVSVQQTYNAAACGPIDPNTGFADGAKCLTTMNSPANEQLIGTGGTLVAPGIKAQYMDEGMIGGEIALPDSIVFGAILQGRRLGRVIEDVSTDGANTYIIANPGEFSAAEERKLQQRIDRTDDKALRERLERQLELYKGIRQFDKPVRDYAALELNLSRRFSTGYYLAASYTYSRTEGNYPGLVSYDNGQIDPNISSQYDLIELLGNRRGRLPQDRPHYVKVDAYRDFDLGKGGSAGQLTLGTRIRALSGIPRTTLASHYLYGPDESHVLPRGTLGRTDFEHGIDVHVGFKRKLTDKTSAELYIDVFNLYNRQGTFRVDDTYAPQYSLTGGGVGGLEQNVTPISGGNYEDLIWAKTISSTGAETAIPVGRNPNFGNTTARYAPASAQVGFRVTF
jgi:outer membrane receptor protein involved in Fe transport